MAGFPGGLNVADLAPLIPGEDCAHYSGVDAVRDWAVLVDVVGGDGAVRVGDQVGGSAGLSEPIGPGLLEQWENGLMECIHASGKRCIQIGVPGPT